MVSCWSMYMLLASRHCHCDAESHTWAKAVWHHKLVPQPQVFHSHQLARAHAFGNHHLDLLSLRACRETRCGDFRLLRRHAGELCLLLELLPSNLCEHHVQECIVILRSCHCALNHLNISFTQALKDVTSFDKLPTALQKMDESCHMIIFDAMCCKNCSDTVLKDVPVFMMIACPNQWVRTIWTRNCEGRRAQCHPMSHL
mmetsp:Transcript_35550/g.63190  ORF Transcript_35550/g.63190 Transcript_35550/m.63190 type:complete len:200 (+) Transcript_35550:1-600(+)